MEIYFVRHGETDVNRILNQGVKGKMHDEPVIFKEGGETNISLNIYGRNQSAEAAQSLPDNIHELYSSSLIRTKETAEIIAKIKNIKQVQILPELEEYSQGTLEGLSKEKKKEMANGKEYGSGLLCNYDYTFWGGDSWETIHDRLVSFLERLKKEDQNKIIVCVTSAGVIRMIYKILFSASAPDLPRYLDITNGSVHKFILL